MGGTLKRTPDRGIVGVNSREANVVAVRKPAVAGAFYPREPQELLRLVAMYVESAPHDGPAPRALIAPHAGYIYSGPIAGSAYARLAAARDTIQRVVLFGPSHRVALQGLATTAMDEFATPLGTVPVDREAIEELQQFPFVRIADDAHAQEHSLEVHLPFLQQVLANFKIVPIVVGDATPEQVEKAIALLWDPGPTLMVISSDLSHYHDYETACRMDKATSDAIESLNPDAINCDQACGLTSIKGLLKFARRHELSAETVDLRNSGDTAGTRDQVVGYGAYVFT